MERNPGATTAQVSNNQYSLISQKLDRFIEPELIFSKLYAQQDHAFWLDSALLKEGFSRFSFMGGVPADKVRTYQLSEDTTHFSTGQTFLKELELDLENTSIKANVDLPFEFRGGWVGYFTYEMKALFGAKCKHHNTIPDALWMKAEQFIAFDHLTLTAWIVAITKEATRKETEQEIQSLHETLCHLTPSCSEHTFANIESFIIYLSLSYQAYLKAINVCAQAISYGQAYEICLTNQFFFDADLDPFELYCIMRKKNPAPLSALIKSGPLFILSTSPEQFLKVNQQGRIQTKPMKGTSARSLNPQQDQRLAAELKASEKNRAENLMIVDLMRNDLSQVSVLGSVVVPKLMDIETFETVHQMVSTVESQLRPECTLIDIIRVSFPGGSISGAPKLQAMEIIDSLETQPRGVYCGAIGYLGYHRIADLNIGIRTLTYDGQQVSFGAGGAITYFSQAEQEVEEIILKAKALIRPLWTYLNGSEQTFNYCVKDKQLYIEKV